MEKLIANGGIVRVFETAEGGIVVRTPTGVLVRLALALLIAGPVLMKLMGEPFGGAGLYVVFLVSLLVPMILGIGIHRQFGSSKGVESRIDLRAGVVRWAGGVTPFASIEEVVVASSVLRSWLGLYGRTSGRPVSFLTGWPAMQRADLERVAALVREKIATPGAMGYRGAPGTQAVAVPDLVLHPAVGIAVALYAAYSVILLVFAPSWTLSSFHDTAGLPLWVIPMGVGLYLLAFKRRGLVRPPTLHALGAMGATPRMRPRA